MRFEAFNSVLGYDFDKNVWVFDAKYCLIDGWWCWPVTYEKLFKLSDTDLREIEKYEDYIKMKESEYQSKDSFEECRKRSCLCKKCFVKCCKHCCDCSDKILQCQEFM